tara:strand:+ start:402 stop:608 length:207 start_codon:yes stop_codon:yes gene_type:complete
MPEVAVDQLIKVEPLVLVDQVVVETVQLVDLLLINQTQLQEQLTLVVEVEAEKDVFPHQLEVMEAVEW